MARVTVTNPYLNPQAGTQVAVAQFLTGEGYEVYPWTGSTFMKPSELTADRLNRVRTNPWELRIKSAPSGALQSIVAVFLDHGLQCVADFFFRENAWAIEVHGGQQQLQVFTRLAERLAERFNADVEVTITRDEPLMAGHNSASFDL